jgi:hypothetical protein
MCRYSSLKHSNASCCDSVSRHPSLSLSVKMAARTYTRFLTEAELTEAANNLTDVPSDTDIFSDSEGSSDSSDSVSNKRAGRVSPIIL